MTRRSLLWTMFTMIHFIATVVILSKVSGYVKMPAQTVGIVITASPLWGLLWTFLYMRWYAWYNTRCYHRLFRSNQCQQCGYDLFGNRSGACPECGEPRPFCPWRV